ncbi:MAG TPA: sulfotransferase [Sphingobium sp.]
MSTVTDILEKARSATSFDDFGEDSFREGLERLLVALDREARLTDAGRAALDQMITNLLSNRLQVEHWYHLHPEIDEQEIVAPLIGLGAPRTGSTALACLLAEDPAVRSLRTWESGSPCPPPESETENIDPRILAAEQGLAHQFKAYPRMRSMLPQSATSPTECQNFMGYDFKSQIFFPVADVPSYRDWLCNEADLVPTYRYVKRVLKLLQWRCPPHKWRLKNPSHSMFIGALTEVFPDARFWMTHRSITSVIPSVSDLYFEMMSAFSDDVDKKAIGQMNVEFWETALERLIAFRAAGNDSRFHDIHFRPFMADPIASIAELYAFLGEEFTPEARARMDAWRRDTPRDKHGSHEYDASKFDLDNDEIKRRFAFYSTRFGLD